MHFKWARANLEIIILEGKTSVKEIIFAVDRLCLDSNWCIAIPIVIEKN
jgi:hypothetical protein